MTVLVLVMFPVLIALGIWQLERGDKKRQTSALSDRAPVTVEALGHVPDLSAVTGGRRVRLKGGFVPGADILIDNQTLRGHPGLAVLSPFRLSGGGLVLTTRAWISARQDRRDFARSIPPLKSTQDDSEILSAELWPLHRHPGPGSVRDAGGWPKLVQRLYAEDPARWFDETVAPVIAWQLEGDGSRPLPAVPSISMTPMRHYGYAGQWFALAAVLLMLYVWFGFRSQAHNE